MHNTSSSVENAVVAPQQSLYQFVKDNLNDEGFFVPSALPDKLTDSQFPVELGSFDAFYKLSGNGSDFVAAQYVHKLLLNYSANPDSATLDALQKVIEFLPCVTYYEYLADYLSQENFPLALLELALRLLRTSSYREEVKFAIFICAIYNVDTIVKERDPALLSDLLMLARCEEFTYFVLFALETSHCDYEEQLWEICFHTLGWGKVHTLPRLPFTHHAAKDWLLRYGHKVRVYFPGVSLLCLQAGDLPSTLAAKRIDDEIYLGCLEIMDEFCAALVHLELATAQEAPDFVSLQLPTIIRELCRHAATRPRTIPNFMGLVDVRSNLLNLLQAQRWEIMSANDYASLCAAIEDVLASQDWLAQIRAQLVNSTGQVNIMVATFAYELDLNINRELFRILEQDPLQVVCYSLILRSATTYWRRKILSHARKNLSLLTQIEAALPGILVELSKYPGTGRDIIVAGLTCPYDVPRSYAIMTLEAWGPKYLTPTLLKALCSSLSLCQQPFWQDRITALLGSKKQKN